MAQYATPQFIDEPGKIIFFLTFKQFFLMAAGVFISIGLYFFLPLIVALIGAAIVLGGCAMVAFVKVNNMSLPKVFLSFLGFMAAKKNYTWKKKESPYPFKAQKAPEIKTAEIPAQPHPAMKMQGSKLKEIKKLIETKK